MFKIVTIPFDRNTKSFDDDLLNRLLANKQVKTYRVELLLLVPKLQLGNTPARKLQLPFPDEALTHANPLQTP